MAPQKKNRAPNLKISCCKCGKVYSKYEGNFPGNFSTLYENNNNRLPICTNCLDELYFHYVEILRSEKQAIKRMCMKFDWYFCDECYESATKSDHNRTLMRSYISRANLKPYNGKTFDDTLAEYADFESDPIPEIEDFGEDITDEMRNFFGAGFTNDEYRWLQAEYNDWLARYECLTKAQENTFKNLCLIQLNIQQAQLSGNDTTKAMKSYQDLLGTANIKPSQNAETTLADANTFGTLIKKWETEKPIPEPSPEWKDVDNIVKYITIYFLGHLCKMLNITNSYSRMYEEEMRKYRVDKPEYADDDEALFDAVFGEKMSSDG